MMKARFWKPVYLYRGDESKKIRLLVGMSTISPIIGAVKRHQSDANNDIWYAFLKFFPVSVQALFLPLQGRTRTGCTYVTFCSLPMRRGHCDQHCHFELSNCRKLIRRGCIGRHICRLRSRMILDILGVGICTCTSACKRTHCVK